MKFLALATLALATVVSGQTVADFYKGRTDMIQDPTLYISPEGNASRMQRGHGRSVRIPVIPRGGSSRKERVLTKQNRRHLDGVEFTTVPDSDGIQTGLVEFVISGLSSDGKASLVFTAEGETVDPVDLGVFIGDNGEATVGIVFNNHDDAKTYSYDVEVTASDGTVTTVEGGTFEYDGDVSRRSGGIQTLNGGVDVANDPYTAGGLIDGASGRIYYDVADGDETYFYGCSGTVIKDSKTGRSLILTAAHCVYDDIVGTFGSNAIFIPDRDATGTGISGNDIANFCSDEICGCWALSGGVVHDRWASVNWPQRLEYDYGLYVVDDEGSHIGGGNNCGSDALDEAIEELEFKIGVDIEDEHINAFGYPFDQDPDLRFCADTAETVTVPNAPGTVMYWLEKCHLLGGASGGPWLADFEDGTGTVVSVNSWGIGDDGIGMGGPIIKASAARCLVNAARSVDFDALMALPVGEQGTLVSCHDRDCVTDAESSRRRKLRGSESPHDHVLCGLKKN